MEYTGTIHKRKRAASDRSSALIQLQYIIFVADSVTEYLCKALILKTEGEYAANMIE